jgi:hypothetical protein
MPEEHPKYTKRYRDHVDSFVEQGGELKVTDSGLYLFRVGPAYKGDHILYIGDDYVMIRLPRSTVSIPLTMFVLTEELG